MNYLSICNKNVLYKNISINLKIGDILNKNFIHPEIIKFLLENNYIENISIIKEEIQEKEIQEEEKKEKIDILTEASEELASTSQIEKKRVVKKKK